MSTSPAAFPSGPRSPVPLRVAPGIQFSWGRLTSRVSSIETIFEVGGMKREMAFSVLVFPEAGPPQMMTDSPCSAANQK